MERKVVIDIPAQFRVFVLKLVSWLNAQDDGYRDSLWQELTWSVHEIGNGHILLRASFVGNTIVTMVKHEAVEVEPPLVNEDSYDDLQLDSCSIPFPTGGTSEIGTTLNCHHRKKFLTPPHSLQGEMDILLHPVFTNFPCPYIRVWHEHDGTTLSLDDVQSLIDAHNFRNILLHGAGKALAEPGLLLDPRKVAQPVNEIRSLITNIENTKLCQDPSNGDGESTSIARKSQQSVPLPDTYSKNLPVGEIGLAPAAEIPEIPEITEIDHRVHQWGRLSLDCHPITDVPCYSMHICQLQDCLLTSTANASPSPIALFVAPVGSADDVITNATTNATTNTTGHANNATTTSATTNASANATPNTNNTTAHATNTAAEMDYGSETWWLLHFLRCFCKLLSPHTGLYISAEDYTSLEQYLLRPA
mmetsp:Transcript_21192/g.35915  ORF Transcript_21192/g.35915 Transcript_21192/m.35915 type:complete len:418 (-) Transcript_21192:61-1314(-)